MLNITMQYLPCSSVSYAVDVVDGSPAKRSWARYIIYKRGKGVLARLVFWLLEIICRTPMVVTS